MTIDRDPLDILSSLAPPPADPALLARAHARTTTLRAAPPRRRWTWRGSVVVVAACALSAGGIGLATADEPVPSEILDHFRALAEPLPGMPDRPVPDPSTAERVASVPFDDDHQYSLWEAESPEGTTCFGAVVEPTSGGEWPGASGALSCAGPADDSTRAAEQPPVFALFTTTQVEGGLTHFTAFAGATVRATIRFPDGSARDLLAGAGHYFGWVPEGMGSGVVTGYLPDGTEAESFTVHG